MKRILVSAGIIMVAISAGGAGVAHAENEVNAGIVALQAQIQALSQQVQQLQMQFNRRFVAPTASSETATSPSTGSASVSSGVTTVPVKIQAKCFTFVNNLRIGDSNPDVSYLQNMLSDEGFSIAGEEANEFSFGETTAAAVVGFQEKYQSEVLSPSGLARGTGFVGKATRAKLNLLRKCGPIIEEPPKTLLSIVPQGTLEAKQGAYYAVVFKVTGGSGNYDISGSGDIPGLSWTNTYCPPDTAGNAGYCIEMMSTDTITLFGTPSLLSKLHEREVFLVTVSASDRGPIPACQQVKVGEPSVAGTCSPTYGKESFKIIVSDGTITKKNPPVISGASGPISLQVNQEGTWTVKAYDPQGGSLTYSVVWGDEPKSIYPQSAAQPTTRNATQTATFTHTYQSAGGYTIVVYVANDYGQQARTSMTVQVGGTTADSLKILVPNGGETWYQGSTYKIWWDTNITKSPLSAKVSLLRDVVCVQAPCDAQEIPISVSELFVSDSTKSGRAWTIPSDPQLAGKFKMKVSLVYDPCPVIPGYNVRCMAMPYEVASDTSDAPFAISAGTAPFSLNVLSPNGGETWTKGTTQTIRWQDPVPVPSCIVGGPCITPLPPRYYDITLVPYYSSCTGTVCPASAYPYLAPYLIAKSVDSSSSYDWLVGNVLSANATIATPDGSYTIQICRADFTTCDSSDSYFRIVSGMTTNSSPVINGLPAVPSTIVIGQSVKFGWNATDADGDNLSWSVDWGDGIGTGVACMAPNPQNKENWTFAASHAWSVPGAYTVKATVSDCRGGSDSHTFYVTPLAIQQPVPSITVTYPNGGENWIVGEQKTLKWSLAGAPSGSYLQLSLTDGPTPIEIKGYPSPVSGEGALTYAMPTSGCWTDYCYNLKGGSYKISATLYDKQPCLGLCAPESSPAKVIAQDTSDAPFTISSRIMTGSATQMSASEMASMLQSVQNTLDSIRRQLAR